MLGAWHAWFQGQGAASEDVLDRKGVEFLVPVSCMMGNRILASVLLVPKHGCWSQLTAEPACTFACRKAYSLVHTVMTRPNSSSHILYASSDRSSRLQSHSLLQTPWKAGYEKASVLEPRIKATLWACGWRVCYAQASFAAVANRLIVGPVVETLVFSKVPATVSGYARALVRGQPIPEGHSLGQGQGGRNVPRLLAGQGEELAASRVDAG
eukprot:scaffold134272_cov18-Tisochrysis_lutea.AAC.1